MTASLLQPIVGIKEDQDRSARRFEPDVSREAPKSRAKSLHDLKLSVRRDLEWLLNSRSYPEGIDERLEEVKKSVIVYGLPDITGISAAANACWRKNRPCFVMLRCEAFMEDSRGLR